MLFMHDKRYKRNSFLSNDIIFSSTFSIKIGPVMKENSFHDRPNFLLENMLFLFSFFQDFP